jgi:hypothetical protein
MSSTPPHTGVSLPLTEFNFGDFGGDFGASLILRVIQVDHHRMIGVVNHYPMI